MSNMDFKRLVYLFVVCTTFFPNSYYIVNHHHLSFVDDIENFEKNIELDLCKGSLIVNKEAKAVVLGLGGEGRTKSSLMYMSGCALNLHVFAIEHIPLNRTGLISVVGPRMLKREVVTQ